MALFDDIREAIKDGVEAATEANLGGLNDKWFVHANPLDYAAGRVERLFEQKLNSVADEAFEKGAITRSALLRTRINSILNSPSPAT